MQPEVANSPSPPPGAAREGGREASGGLGRRRSRELAFALLVAIAPRLISAALWLLSITLRIRILHAESLFEGWRRGERVIVAFWHNRLLLMPVAASGQRICIITSESRDGEIATRAAARWGIHSVRGSATRGGAKAFLALVRAFRAGYSLAIAPDGPRGPAEKVKPGVIHLARATGARIIPVSYAATHKKRLRSWDRLILPLPFSRVVLWVGDPLTVPRDCDEEQIERFAMQLEQSLCAAGELAERALEGSSDARLVRS